MTYACSQCRTPLKVYCTRTTGFTRIRHYKCPSCGATGKRVSQLNDELEEIPTLILQCSTPTITESKTIE
jgi:hypothetical protein